MQRWESVAIIGVGLMGGSIGLALQQRGLVRSVVGIGRRASSLRKAKRRGAVTSYTTNLARGVAASQLVVVCTPVAQIVPHVLQAAQAVGQGTLITDVGSTKRGIVATLDKQWGPFAGQVGFVGSHPLAGSDKSGSEHADASLFEDRIVVVTPSRRTRPTQTDEISRFWRSLGAKVIHQSPPAHDRSVAAISHLPHVVASALAAATPADDRRLVAGGWLDTTRVAAGEVELWQQILSDNRINVLKSLDKFEKVLRGFRHALEHDSGTQLVRLLQSGKQNRDAVGS